MTTLKRRQVLKAGLSAAASLAVGGAADSAPSRRVAIRGRRCGTIFNNDINNLLANCPADATTPRDYQRYVYAILDLKPGLLAQNVGMPDPVIYPTDVATTWDKYHEEVCKQVWPKMDPADAHRQGGAMKRLLAAGTDPLTLTIDACRKRGVPIVASYRMNGEDFYQGTGSFSDFDRAHPEWKIPDAFCLDPAVPQVFAHRMRIFREVVERYDVDGIEFDFRRWYHMVSDPLRNHPVLTRMVRETRRMLDEVARAKGRERLILGARVGPSLDSEPNPFLFPGIFYDLKPTNASCKELGLDVRTWMREELVDYVCPALFTPSLPGLPLTREFAELAQGTRVGVYPYVPSMAAWMHGVCERSVGLEKNDCRALARYKFDLCMAALTAYADGADGISTFNWMAHLRNARGGFGVVTTGEPALAAGAGADAVQTYVYPLMGDPQAVQRYLDQPWPLPPAVSAAHHGAGEWSEQSATKY